MPTITNSTSEYDVIIVGARIAGSILATLLGQAGHRVLILDRATFPSDTLSSHFFRAPTMRALASIGVLDDVKAVAPQLTVNYNVIDGIEFPEPVDRPDDYPFYMCVRRIILDDILVRRMKRTPHVEFLDGTRVVDLIREEGRVTGVVWRGPRGDGNARARALVGADGVRSFVARAVEAPTEHEQPASRAMYFCYARGVEPRPRAAEFHYQANSIGYCIPTDAGLTLLAASVPIARFGAFKRNPEASLLAELCTMPALAPRLGGFKREGPMRGTGSIPCYRRMPYGRGWVLVGDAGMVFDPWSGQGIDQASSQAVLLARHLGEHMRGDRDFDSAMRAYHRDRNAHAQDAYHRTADFAPDVRPMTRAALERRGLV